MAGTRVGGAIWYAVRYFINVASDFIHRCVKSALKFERLNRRSLEGEESNSCLGGRLALLANTN